jgi:uncharacterized metal-binding protein
MEIDLKCASCGISKDLRICGNPEGVSPAACPTETNNEITQSIIDNYKSDSINEFACNASIQEKEGYQNLAGNLVPAKGRLQEIKEFAIRMGYKKLGLAFCSGLMSEAKILSKLLTDWGFQVSSIICKVGAIPKEELGLQDSDKINPGNHESMCNPLAQAEFLNQAGTELNIMMGLCVGHDALFLKNADAYTTVFAVKDRLYGHNPQAAIYTLDSYSKHLLKS